MAGKHLGSARFPHYQHTGDSVFGRSLNILYFTAPQSDYLADSVLHGLRSLFGESVVDYPRSDLMYADDQSALERAHGRGFTLYGLLRDEGIDRYDVQAKLKSGFFDLIVISSIHRQFGWYVQFQPWLTDRNTIVLDGEDGPELFPYAGAYWRQPAHRSLPRVHKHHLYFKRELTPDTVRYRWYKLVPDSLSSHLPTPSRIRPIAFSFPAEKVVSLPPRKVKDLPRHVVDPEVAAGTSDTSTTHVFSREEDYYADLQASRWGITTKRAGWDCLRHYEIAANGAVPCFRMLRRKPATCAPHGLTLQNCVDYRDLTDLTARLGRISDDRYAELQAASLVWVRNQTTIVRAREVIDDWRRTCG